MVNYNEAFALATKKGYTRKYSDSVLENTRSQSTEDELVYIESCLIQRWLRANHNIDITTMIRFADTYGVIIHRNRNIPKGFEEIIPEVTYENRKMMYESALIQGVYEALKLIPDAKT